jgi:hypothetical protein
VRVIHLNQSDITGRSAYRVHLSDVSTFMSKL